MLDLAVIGQDNALFRLCDPHEECGHLVVLRLRPAVERVIVALGAPGAGAHQRLCRQLHLQLRIRLSPQEIGCSEFSAVADRRQYLPDHRTE